MARVLIGYSRCQLTRDAFARQGHEAWTCDLLPVPGSAFHRQCDVWTVLREEWDFALLHPMCTYLTVSAAWAYKDGPYHQKVKPGTLVGDARRKARDEALTNFRALLALPFPVAIENPAQSFINTAIRSPNQVIHPWQFGDDASKATGLWLTKGVPALVLDPRVFCQPRYVCAVCRHTMRERYTVRCTRCNSRRLQERWGNQTDNGQNNLTPSDDRWLDRSATYPGIARAVGEQWGAWLQSHTRAATRF